MKTQLHPFILGLLVCFAAAGILGCQRDNKTVQAMAEPNSAEQTAPTAPSAKTQTGPDVTNVVEDADRTFILQAEKDNIGERVLGSLAEEKSQDPGIRNYGKMLGQDHNAALQQLVDLMSKYGIAQPNALPEERQAAINDVKGLSGAVFDRHFIDLMLKDHEKAIADFQHAAASARNNDVKNYAENQIPVLQKHLNKARELQSKIEAKPASVSFNPFPPGKSWVEGLGICIDFALCATLTGRVSLLAFAPPSPRGSRPLYL